MDIPSDKYKSGVNRSGPFSAVLHTVLGIVRWLAGLAIVTDENRIKAGIYLAARDVADR
jgi:hypothetical protein